LRQSSVRAAWSGVLSIWMAACLYDPDRRCDTKEREIEADRCVCAAGFVARAGACVTCPEGEVEQGGRCVCAPDRGRDTVSGTCAPCAENETQDNEECVCAPGFSRDDATGACAPSGLGAACENDLSCADPAHPSCYLVDGASGYCTRLNCATPADCEGGFACDLTVSPSHCARPPVGQGQPCESAADCAGTEATYCETFMTNVCLVERCTVGGSDCFTGWSCCDLSGFGLNRQLCVLDGSCPSP
jgi:hypothetical protein